MPPERVTQKPCRNRRSLHSFAKTIHARHAVYGRRVYRRTLHPSYIPWVQAVCHPVLSRYRLAH